MASSIFSDGIRTIRFCKLEDQLMVVREPQPIHHRGRRRKVVTTDVKRKYNRIKQAESRQRKKVMTSEEKAD